MSENDIDIIIVGAGAAGLAAAVELSKAGKKVLVLEARNRIGGRIHTITPDGFALPIEAGAEFVHGDLPVTLSMLKEYKIPYHSTGGEMFRTYDGQLTPGSWEVPGFDKLFEELQKVEDDISVQEFLETNFSDAKYLEMNNAVRGFVEGFDTGEISTASILKFREEWSAIEEEGQYRVEGGYSRLIQALSNRFKEWGGIIFLLSPVTSIKWKKNQAQVLCGGNKTYTGSKILFTVPLGILQAEAGTNSYINFVPPVEDKISAARKMGYGAIIKAVFQFSEKFWERYGFEKNNVGFIFSNTLVPTFWTQMPNAEPILTAWMGGPTAREWQYLANEQILQIIVSSLAGIFGISEGELKAEIQALHVVNWTNEPYTLGSYSFATVDGNEAIAALSEPVEDTLFFAGEALYTGAANGTVEAALSNGLDVAAKILRLCDGI